MADRSREAREAACRRACVRRSCGASPSRLLAQAQDDATIVAIKAQEDAGLDIITDGEIRRESYSNRFATALEGVDIDNPGTVLGRSGRPNSVPRIVGPIRRKHPVEVDDVRFLRAHTTKPIKMTVPGPFTMSQQAQNDYYPERRGARHGLCRRGQRGDPRSLRRRCRHRPDRRAVHAGAARESARSTDSKRSIARSKESAGQLRCTSASVMPPSCTSALPAIRFCPSSPVARAGRSRWKRRNRSSTVRCLAKLAGKQIMVGCLDLNDIDGGDAGGDRRAHQECAAHTLRRRTSSSPRTAG